VAETDRRRHHTKQAHEYRKGLDGRRSTEDKIVPAFVNNAVQAMHGQVADGIGEQHDHPPRLPGHSQANSDLQDQCAGTEPDRQQTGAEKRPVSGLGAGSPRDEPYDSLPLAYRSGFVVLLAPPSTPIFGRHDRNPSSAVPRCRLVRNMPRKPAPPVIRGASPRFAKERSQPSLIRALRQRPEIRAPQSDLWVRWSSSSRDGIRRP
jgi:hypothetical protein